jgi:hypothetical protein
MRITKTELHRSSGSEDVGPGLLAKINKNMLEYYVLHRKLPPVPIGEADLAPHFFLSNGSGLDMRFSVARPAGFEPATRGLEERAVCSPGLARVMNLPI